MSAPRTSERQDLRHTYVQRRDQGRDTGSIPLVSVILPAFNEEAILESNLEIVHEYLTSLQNRIDFEILVIDDGSTDATGDIAEELTQRYAKLRVIHHPVNLNLGRALRTGFDNSLGDYVVVLDLDLSYSVDHIALLLDTIVSTKAQVVVASPYRRGGKVSQVPWLRGLLSRWANRFLAFFSSHPDLTTITGMVRAYEGTFIRALDLKATDIEVNFEILYKTMLLRGEIVEIPAHLDWTLQRGPGRPRMSSFRIMHGIMTYVISGFVFRPFMFFLLPGMLLGLVSIYVIGWTFYNLWMIFDQVQVQGTYFDDRFSSAVAILFSERPHAFFIGGLVLLLALQLLSLSFLSFQNKKYFEELFHLSSSIRKRTQDDPKKPEDESS